MKKVKRILTLSVCLTLAVCTAFLCAVFTSAAGKFTDVPEKSWYTAAVLKANELGIMNGTSDTTFAPLKNLTRAEYVAILFRLSGGEENLPFSFTDVPEKAWYKKYVGWAEQSGVITGYGNPETFGGNELITREQLMLMTSRYMKYEWVSFEDSATAVEFADRDKIAKWAADGVEVTRKAGLIAGDKNANFNPKDPATRAEIATIVVRYVDALPSAKDPMHMKLQSITDLVECDGKSPIINVYGNYFPIRIFNGPNTIGEQFLPQMKLDHETYELSMDSEHYEYVKKTYNDATSFGGLEADDFRSIIIRLAIRNKTTNEVTATKTIPCNVYYRRITDSESYELGLPEDMLNSIKEASFKSIGNVARIAKAFDKAKTEGELNVVYLGGSLTEGGAYDADNWASGTTQWFQKQFPNAKVNAHNAGIGGTRSDYANIRLQEDVLDHDPDIVFIDYTVNDSSDSDYFKQSIDGLVRTCLGYEKNTAVILMLTANSPEGDTESFRRCRDMHVDLAEYYGLPVIDFHESAKKAVSYEYFTFDDLTRDGLHPATWFYQMQAETVRHMLDTIVEKISTASAAELTVKALPDKLFGPGYKFLGLHHITASDKDKLTTLGSWRVNDKDDGTDAYECTGLNGNAPLEFEFTGTDLYVRNFVRSIESGVAQLKINIDGVDYIHTGSTENAFRVAEGLENKTHKVKISVNDPTEGQTGTVISIVYK